MEVIRSKTMGFCMGVKQVVDLAHECLRIAKDKGVPAYSIGWFIHNQRVVKQLADLGLRHIERPEEGVPGVALIRAHGITDVLRQEFIDAGYELIDGTCRNVASSQSIIRNTGKNTLVVVAGIAGHSEVVALSGVTTTENTLIPTVVVQSVNDVQNLPDDPKTVILMTQTTLPALDYRAILQAMKDKYGTALRIGNHLCAGALRRNKALLELCETVEAIVVVGGKNSANTAALVRLVEEFGLPAFHVESALEITEEMRSFNRVGLTAGTSTSQHDIDDVYSELKGVSR